MDPLWFIIIISAPILLVALVLKGLGTRRSRDGGGVGTDGSTGWWGGDSNGDGGGDGGGGGGGD